MVLNQLCYGDTFDRIAKDFALPESTSANCLRHFCDAIVELYEDEDLRLPNGEEMKEFSNLHDELGFPECFGGLDCAIWA